MSDLPEVKMPSYPVPCDRCGQLLWRGAVAWEVKRRPHGARQIWCESCGERP